MWMSPFQPPLALWACCGGGGGRNRRDEDASRRPILSILEQPTRLPVRLVKAENMVQDLMAICHQARKPLTPAPCNTRPGGIKFPISRG
jgi:hypothetical protein